jgi:hypothetical protein
MSDLELQLLNPASNMSCTPPIPDAAITDWWVEYLVNNDRYQETDTPRNGGEANILEEGLAIKGKV